MRCVLQSMEQAEEVRLNGTSSTSPPTNGTGSPPSPPTSPVQAEPGASKPVPIPGAGGKVAAGRALSYLTTGFLEMGLSSFSAALTRIVMACMKRACMKGKQWPHGMRTTVVQVTWRPAAVSRARRSSAAA